MVAKAQVQGAQRQQDWMLCADEKDVKIYRAEDKVHTSTHGTMYMYAGTTQVVGAVDEFVALFKNETTIEAKEYCRRFANRLMDSVVLYALVKPSEEQPYERIGINWRAFESWGGKLFQNRDSCLLEVLLNSISTSRSYRSATTNSTSALDAAGSVLSSQWTLNAVQA
ncbi:unnamed protein product [Aphanomyces euteiches]